MGGGLEIRQRRRQTRSREIQKAWENSWADSFKYKRQKCRNQTQKAGKKFQVQTRRKKYESDRISLVCAPVQTGTASARSARNSPIVHMGAVLSKGHRHTGGGGSRTGISGNFKPQT